jgi:hypothetical protein
VSLSEEFEVLKHTLVECDTEGIEVGAIGLGVAPLHLSHLCPIAVHGLHGSDFIEAMKVAFGTLEQDSSGDSNVSSVITPAIIKVQLNSKEINEIKKNLSNPEAAVNKDLIENIDKKPMSMDMFETFANTKILFMEMDKNSAIEPYRDGMFAGFRILIVCLYLGLPGTPDEKISPTVFHEGCGKSLKRKGFFCI